MANEISVIKSGYQSSNITKVQLNQIFEVLTNDIGLLDTGRAVFDDLIPVIIQEHWAIQQSYTVGSDLQQRYNDGAKLQNTRLEVYQQFFGRQEFGDKKQYTKTDFINLGSGLTSFSSNLVASFDMAYNRKMSSIILSQILNCPFGAFTQYDPKNYIQGYVLNGAGAYSTNPADLTLKALNKANAILAQQNINSPANLGTGRKIVLCSMNTLTDKFLELDQLKNQNYADREQAKFRGLSLAYQDMTIWAPPRDLDIQIPDNQVYAMLDKSVRAYSSNAIVDYNEWNPDTSCYEFYYNRAMGAGIELPSSIIKIIIN